MTVICSELQLCQRDYHSQNRGCTVEWQQDKLHRHSKQLNTYIVHATQQPLYIQQEHPAARAHTGRRELTEVKHWPQMRRVAKFGSRLQELLGRGHHSPPIMSVAIHSWLKRHSVRHQLHLKTLIKLIQQKGIPAKNNKLIIWTF